MAKKKAAATTAEDLELNMTPMIDVVFNLIIFFMIVTDMTQKELEDLKLPDSRASIEDKDDDNEIRVIINISKDRKTWDTKKEVELKIKGIEYDLDALKAHLWKIAEQKRNPDDPSGANPSEVFVLVRCDKDIAWKEVQWVMQACAHPDVRIYKLQFATAEQEAD